MKQLETSPLIHGDTDKKIPAYAGLVLLEYFFDKIRFRRGSSFHELDTYDKMEGLNSRALMEGLGLDPRTGHRYNNLSFSRAA